MPYKKTKAILFFVSLSLIFASSFFSTAFAQAEGGSAGKAEGGTNAPSVPIKVVIQNPFKFKGDLYSFLEAVIKNIVIPIGGVLCVLGFIYSGFRYVMARGEKGDIEKAKEMLIASSIGTVLILGSWVIAEALRNTLSSVLK